MASLIDVLAAMRRAMRDFQRPGLWMRVWLFGWALCIVLSLVPVPGVDVGVEDSDKIGHFLAYATLSLWAMMIFRSWPAKGRAMIALVLLGLCMEWAQGALTDYRQAEWRDAVANTLGVLLGGALGLTPIKRLLVHIDARLFAASPNRIP
jgi:VanZ family protein